MRLKLKFLEIFLTQFQPLLREASIKINIKNVAWDKIESLYSVRLRDIVERKLSGVLDPNVLTMKWTPKDHRFLSI